MARSSQRTAELFRRQMANRERVSEGTVLRPVGNKREVVINKDCNNPRLMSTLTPTASSAPGSIVPILGAGGGDGLVAAESTITGKDVGNEQQGHSVPGLSLNVSSLALRATDSTGGNMTIDIAEFFKESFVSILLEGIVLSGIRDPLTATQAAQSLGTATSVSGLSGITDGSIMLFVINTDPSPREITVHVIDIGDGTVHSRIFAPGFVPATFLAVTGKIVQNDKIFFMIHYPGDARVQLVEFPPKLTSQTIINDEIYTNLGSVQPGTQFFANDALNALNATLTNWHRIPFGGGAIVEDFVVDKPDLGYGLDGHPISLGFMNDKYWSIGQGPATGSPPPFNWDIKPFFAEDTVDDDDLPVLAVDDVAANGWQDMAAGLSSGLTFYQFWNGTRKASYDIDPGGMYGFPIWTTPGPDAADGTPGLMFLPFTANSWGNATFTQIDTSIFSPATMVADRRVR